MQASEHHALRGTPRQDPEYRLFWVLTVDVTSLWVRPSNAIFYWSLGSLSFLFSCAQAGVSFFPGIATWIRSTALLVPQQRGPSSKGPFPLEKRYRPDPVFMMRPAQWTSRTLS